MSGLVKGMKYGESYLWHNGFEPKRGCVRKLLIVVIEKELTRDATSCMMKRVKAMPMP
jgi:hypothetical protein